MTFDNNAPNDCPKKTIKINQQIQQSCKIEWENISGIGIYE